MTLLMESNVNLRTKLFEFLQLLNKFDVIESVKKTRNIEDFRNKVCWSGRIHILHMRHGYFTLLKGSRAGVYVREYTKMNY